MKREAIEGVVNFFKEKLLTSIRRDCPLERALLIASVGIVIAKKICSTIDGINQNTYLNGTATIAKNVARKEGRSKKFSKTIVTPMVNPLDPTRIQESSIGFITQLKKYLCNGADTFDSLLIKGLGILVEHSSEENWEHVILEEYGKLMKQ